METISSKQITIQTRADYGINHQIAGYESEDEEGASALLTTDDLKKIVSLSGLNSRVGLELSARPFQVVAYKGGTYKVRACQSAEVAEQWLQLLGGVNYLFSHCYGQ